MIMYFKGDKVKLTGNTTKAYGTEWAEFIYLEGHKKGKKGEMDMNHYSYTCQLYSIGSPQCKGSDPNSCFHA